MSGCYLLVRLVGRAGRSRRRPAQSSGSVSSASPVDGSMEPMISASRGGGLPGNQAAATEPVATSTCSPMPLTRGRRRRPAARPSPRPRPRGRRRSAARGAVASPIRSRRPVLSASALLLDVDARRPGPVLRERRDDDAVRRDQADPSRAASLTCRSVTTPRSTRSARPAPACCERRWFGRASGRGSGWAQPDEREVTVPSASRLARRGPRTPAPRPATNAVSSPSEASDTTRGSGRPRAPASLAQRGWEGVPQHLAYEGAELVRREAASGHDTSASACWPRRRPGVRRTRCRRGRRGRSRRPSGSRRP